MPARPSAPVTVWPAIAILIAGLAAYSNSFSGVFVFDDEPAIQQNANLEHLWPLTAAMSAPPRTTLAGRPVATLSFAIDRALSGGSLAGYHATNLCIHLAAALLVFGVTRRTLWSAALRESFAEAATPLALAVALLFVVHPLQTGSVTYVVQRVESLMGMLYLAALYCAIRAGDASGRARAVWSVAAILACALGMATKEVMATAPLAVMAWDRVFTVRLKADTTNAGPARWPLYASLMATWIVLGVLVAGGHRTSSVGFGFADWPWWRYLATQAGVLTHYLRLAVIPTPLVLDYAWPAASVRDALVPGLVLCALLAWTVWGVVRRRPAAFCGAWFFLILAPTSSVVPIVTEVAAEHRMYLPLAGLIALAVAGLFALGRRWRIPAVAGVVAAAAAVILFARMTYARNADYHDGDRIWADTIAKRPRNARARNNYATSLLAQGRFAEAETHLRVAVDEQPSFAEAQANLGIALSSQGRLDEGAEHLRRAIALQPDYASAHRNLGETYAMQHRLGDAVAEYARALERQPEDAFLLNRLAWILATAADPGLRDGVRARAYAEKAVALTRRQDADALDSLAAALAEAGDFAAAAATAAEGSRVASSTGKPALARDLDRRAALYGQRQPYREP